MKRCFLLIMLIGLSACSFQDKTEKKQWIDNLISKPLYGKNDKSELFIDKNSGDFKAGGKLYKFNEVKSSKTAVYTQNTGAYVGIIITEDGLKTAKYVDAVTAPSQQKNNIDFSTPQYTVATYIK